MFRLVSTAHVRQMYRKRGKYCGIIDKKKPVWIRSKTLLSPVTRKTYLLYDNHHIHLF
jgi:hypothetical protein